jgi:hypothetical protein
VSDGVRRSTVAFGSVLAIVLIVSSVVIWNTQNHEARIGLGWAIPALLAAAATFGDLRSRPSPPMPVSFAITAAWFYFLAVLTLLVLIFGWIFSILGVIFGMPATALAWLARKRAMEGRVDGALLSAAMLIATGVFALARPWTPSSPQWLWGAGVAFAGAALLVGDIVVHRFVRPAEDCLVS